MSLHPIRALDAVIREYRDYLQTEFRAKDPELKTALERELDRPLFLSQEPFYQAHRPFKHGARWQDLPVDRRLARVMELRSHNEHAYLHQSDAIAHLLGPEASPVVVTTGTGSGKTEAFLLPVIQNAIDDAVRFNRSGLTAILLYPMNALANDQLMRIDQYLEEAGWRGAISVKRYDRGTRQVERDEMRQHPPHILLTNYMMLEYLLVRPADRDGIFANHRCRFLALDEVHTYRGTLGSNIALLVRRLRAHLARARQDWNIDVADVDRFRRYPTLIPVGTSATIKSINEETGDRAEVRRQRDAEVRQFFAAVAGVGRETIKVLGEELENIETPAEARYLQQPAAVQVGSLGDAEAVRIAICALAGQSTNCGLETAVRRCRLLWDLGRWLVARPMSIGQIVDKLLTEIPERRGAQRQDVQREVEAALALGAALPDDLPGSLRLRAHRFIRGGWQFHRCISPTCGRIYPMGETQCACGHQTAPLYLCRNCGADYLRLFGNPATGPLRSVPVGPDDPEHLVYDYRRLEAAVAPDDDDDADDGGGAIDSAQLRRRAQQPQQMRGRPVLRGSFDPSTLAFSNVEIDYPWPVMLAPARTRCLSCGGSAGSRSVLTPVALGTSAAVKVLAEGIVESLAKLMLVRTDTTAKSGC